MKPSSRDVTSECHAAERAAKAHECRPVVLLSPLWQAGITPAQLMADIGAAAERRARHKITNLGGMLLQQPRHRDAATRQERSTKALRHLCSLAQHELSGLLPGRDDQGTAGKLILTRIESAQLTPGASNSRSRSRAAEQPGPRGRNRPHIVSAPGRFLRG